jgi:Lipocalin-like domain
MRFIFFTIASIRIGRSTAIAACAALCVTLCVLAPSRSARAADPTMTMSPLEGTWALKAADEIRKDGSRVPQFGEQPQGLLIVDAEGRYSLQIFRANRTPFAHADKTLATADEFRASELSMNSHYGNVEMDPSQHTLTFHIVQASFPNWNGAVQVRQYTLSGDVLSYQIPASATGSGKISVSVWQRINQPSTQPTGVAVSDP